MPRLDPDAFADRDLARIFITPKLGDARKAEAVLSGRGVDYVVVAEPVGRTLLGFTRTGACFYVAADQADACADLLTAAGLSRGVVPPDTAE